MDSHAVGGTMFHKHKVQFLIWYDFMYCNMY